MGRFDSLKYPVHKLKPGEKIDQAFPQLFKSPEFKKIRARADYHRLACYIVLLYDKGTDLTAEHPKNLQARKDAAAIEAGYERVAGKWPKQIQDVMDIRDRDATAAIFQFLKDQKYHLWTDIIVTEQELDEFQRLRFQNISSGKSKKKTADTDLYAAANKKDSLMEACSTRISRLEMLYKQFYEDHMDVKEAEFDEIITPEKAERILAKEGKPYEELKEEVTDVSSD